MLILHELPISWTTLIHSASSACSIEVHLNTVISMSFLLLFLRKTCIMIFPAHAVCWVQRCWITLNDGRRRVHFRNLLNMYFFHTPSISFLSYNRPILVVVNTNSTQGIYRMVVTGNFKCVYRLDDKKDNWGSATSGLLPQLEVQYSQLKYLCSALPEISSTKLHLFVIVPYFPFNLLARVSAKNCLQAQLGLAWRPHPWSSINSCPIDVCRKLQRMFFSLQGVRAAIRSQHLVKSRPNPSGDKHCHKLINNLEVRILPIYQLGIVLLEVLNLCLIFRMQFCLSLRRAYLWSDFEPGSSVTVVLKHSSQYVILKNLHSVFFKI